jgi:hypothetical protein
MPITVHEGDTIIAANYVVEENVFHNCKLKNCRLFYSGGAFEILNCSFDNCQWGFRGEAANTMQLLMTLGVLKPGQAPPASIAGATGGQVH